MNLRQHVTDVGGTARAATDAERLEAGIRPAGKEIFDAMSTEEQDATYGEDIAQALREGKITFADLVMREGGFIKQRPAEDLNLN